MQSHTTIQPRLKRIEEALKVIDTPLTEREKALLEMLKTRNIKFGTEVQNQRLKAIEIKIFGEEE